MTLPWIRILVDFWERPSVVDLEDINPLHGKRLQRLILEACKCGAGGKLAHVQGGSLRPLTAKHLARRLNDDPTELQQCIDLCVEMGELTIESGFITVPDPDSYWGPLTAAERKQAQRSRDQHEDPLSASAPSSDQPCGKLSTASTTGMPSALAPSGENGVVEPMSRARHADVTPSHDASQDRDLYKRTEQNRTERQNEANEKAWASHLEEVATLRAENERLRAELEDAPRTECCLCGKTVSAGHTTCYPCRSENERLRAEVESYRSASVDSLGCPECGEERPDCCCADLFDGWEPLP